jgi:hypothetical protein
LIYATLNGAFSDNGFWGSKMHIDDLNAACGQIDAGGDIASIDPSLLEQVWKAISSIPREQRESAAVGHHMACARVEPDRIPQTAEQQVAMMMRYTLLNALVERGVLDEYMKDESLRRKVFATAALFPCDKHDLGEAVAQRLAFNSSPGMAQKASEELREAGYVADHPNVAGKFIAWMRDHR